MRKNFILRLSFMIACSLSLHSCHTEDFQDEISRQSTEKGKLKAFEDFEKRIHTSLSAREGAEDSYAYPFAETLYQVFEKNPEYKKSFQEVFGEVDFGVASQTFGEAEKLVYFPILKNGKLNYILSCAINEKRTDAYYKILEPGEVKEYEIVTNTFINYYGSISNPTARNEPTYNIEEIIIEWTDPIPWWWYMTYGGANTPVPFPGPSGGSVSVPNPQTHPIGGNITGGDPCEETKNILNNPKSKPAIDDMKNQSGLAPSDPNSGEIGYKFKEDGTPSPKIIGDDHSVDFGDKTGYAGGYHNHTTAGGIPMLSVPDIDQLLGFARAQGNYGTPSNAFLGMVAPNGMHYVIWFNGTYQDALTNFSQEQLDEYTDKYQTRYGIHKPASGSMSNEAIERFFFKALRDMGLDGKINLQRIENDGTIKTVTKNNDGTTTAVPCP
ncbi:hypothetical protein N0B40_05245 [Chryseobacterium oranimense]|uniref:hypothetical protein n=1 Tax=Chryseobacterium oranimense TaxID=421058 RepID=UPI0021AEAE4F|nr:hypothetical protein [Chryseobacterium oranimense]UWX61686.1 hypothetical protein N0B40_05245 [Chryseobacterium oranimense]